ncbi:MAG TPA: metallophosphoesterase [Myxococcota bacterium]|nr:metallophosphoesterase [Myxococcota bacterium]
MKTVVLSDTHLGNGQGYDIFAGAEALPAFLDSFPDPIRLVINGDVVDFLMNEDPLSLEVSRAIEQARAIVANPPTRGTLRALGRILAKGGDVFLRLGNHDVEMFLPEVQAIFRAALDQPPEVAKRLIFQTGEDPMILEIGGARLLVAHGEHNDAWNRIDYASLQDRDGDVYPDFVYPPGSKLVKELLNPLKREYGLRFADLIKPDMQGGFLTVLGVNPQAAKAVAGQANILSLGWQLLKRMAGPFTFGDQEEDLHLSQRVDEAGLTAEEADALEAILGDGPLSFSGDDPAADAALTKMGRVGLKLYAAAHRSLVGNEAEDFFELDPEAAEWGDAVRLSGKYGVGAVITGHTHAARWAQRLGLAVVNTGTWIWLMSPPAPDAPVSEWERFLRRLRANPNLDPRPGEPDLLQTIFTAAVVEPAGEGGARLSLVEWRDGRLIERKSGVVAPGGPFSASFS